MPRARDLQNLHDRSILGPEYQRRLREPDATLGWSGDPDLVLAYNRLLDVYEVWREEPFFDHATGKWVDDYVVVARRNVRGARFDIAELIRGLVARDSWIEGQSAEKAMEKYLADVEAEAKAHEDAMFEALRPVHEKLAWTVARDTGDLTPFVSLSGASNA